MAARVLEIVYFRKVQIVMGRILGQIDDTAVRDELSCLNETC